MNNRVSTEENFNHQKHTVKSVKSKSKLSRKIIASVLAVMTVSFAAIGFFSYFSYKNDMIDAYAKRAADLAQSISVNIDANDIAQYDATGSKDDDYAVLIDYLSRVKKMTGVEYVYIMTDSGTSYKYIADGIVEGQGVVSDLGDEDNYDAYGDEPKIVLKTGQAKVSQIYDGGEEYGDLISAFAPIIGSDGKTVAVLGIDLKPTAIKEGNFRYLLTVLCILVGSSVIIFIILYFIIRRMITMKIKLLTAGAQALAAGEVNISLKNKTNDELGELFDSCTIMTENIKIKSEAAQKIAQGDLNVQLKTASENDLLAVSMNTMISTLSDFSSELTRIIEASHSGDFTYRGNEKNFQGEYAQMVSGVNTILNIAQQAIIEAESANTDSAQQAAALKALLLKINESAEQVAEGTGQITTGSRAISDGAASQTYAIEALTASIGEIANQSNQNAIYAGKASELTAVAKGCASDGNEKMMQMQSAMKQISESTGSIGKITKAIDDIAFQTNILALNAAVEAARAGIHGKGFAIVAEEVRNLAAKSADAAKETTAIVEDSVQKTEAGSKIADETVTALKNIVSGVEKVEELIAEIADASGRQAAGVSQINQGIEQVKQVVMANSVTAREAAEASGELFEQASTLKQMAGTFMLKEKI